VQIRTIDRTMNMGYVRLEGTAGDVYVKKSPSGLPDYVAFNLDDGTGTARVGIHAHEARILGKENRLPRRGDRVSVEGSVRVGPDGQVSLHVQSARRFGVFPPAALHCEPHEILPELAGRTVRVEGRIAAVYPPRPGGRAPYRVVIGGDRGAVDLVLWEENYQALRERGLGPGAEVVARVRVDRYKEKLQLRIKSPEDVAITPATGERAAGEPAAVEPAAEGAVAAVLRTPEGRRTSLRARVVSVKRFKKGVRVTVTDGEQNLPVILFDEVFSGWPGMGDLVPGVEVEVRGKVQSFRDRIELVVEEQGELRLMRPGPRPRPGPDGTVATAAVNRLAQGNRAAVKGRIVERREIKGGLRLRVDDGSGPCTVVLWDGVLGELGEGISLGRGSSLRVTGEIRLYRGEPQLVPTDPLDVAGGE
jgi:DNA/RNA endonuclease YhcR with UshA esterase domain